MSSGVVNREAPQAIQTETFGNARTPGLSTRLRPLKWIIISAVNSASFTDVHNAHDMRHTTFRSERYSNPSLFVCSILHTCSTRTLNGKAICASALEEWAHRPDKMTTLVTLVPRSGFLFGHDLEVITLHAIRASDGIWHGLSPKRRGGREGASEIAERRYP
jgi:hypothetical protein